MDKLALLKRYFDKDGYVKLSKVEIVEVSKEKAVVSASISKEHLNGNGAVQGGMLYTVADFAFAVLSNYLHPMTVTQNGHISYLKAAFTDTITATAVEKARVGRNTVCEVTVCNADGEIVCMCSFNGFVKDVSWEEFAQHI